MPGYRGLGHVAAAAGSGVPRPRVEHDRRGSARRGVAVVLGTERVVDGGRAWRRALVIDRDGSGSASRTRCRSIRPRKARTSPGARPPRVHVGGAHVRRRDLPRGLALSRDRALRGPPRCAGRVPSALPRGRARLVSARRRSPIRRTRSTRRRRCAARPRTPATSRPSTTRAPARARRPRSPAPTARCSRTSRTARPACSSPTSISRSRPASSRRAAGGRSLGGRDLRLDERERRREPRRRGRAVRAAPAGRRPRARKLVADRVGEPGTASSRGRARPAGCAASCSARARRAASRIGGDDLVHQAVALGGSRLSMRPVRISSRARGSPTARTRRVVPPTSGTRPNAISGRPSTQSSLAMRMSAASASSSAMPTHTPCSAAITGWCSRLIRWNVSWSWWCRCENGVCCVAPNTSTSSAWSMPLENTEPRPRSTTTRTRAIGADLVERRAELRHHRAVHRVALVGAVEPDGGDRSGTFDLDPRHAARYRALPGSTRGVSRV